jgi:hypothetical protein
MNLKVMAEASLNGITKDMHLHHGSVNGKHGKLTKLSWDSSLPFPSKYFYVACRTYVSLKESQLASVLSIEV